MKLLWFHLMPYTDLPDDFTKKHASVWVDIDSRLFDPAKAHGMYNDFMDELEFAAEIGFDGVCVNEHHQNAYGLMPSPNIIAASLARRTRDAAIVVMGNSLALYNPPMRVAEEFAMLDVISGGRLVAGFPVGTPMDTCFAYGQNPSQLRDRYFEAHDLIVKSWTDARHVHVERPLQQAALREPVAAPAAEAAPADLDPRRRLDRDVALVRGDGLRLRLSELLRLQARPGHHAGLLGRDGAARQGQEPVPRRLPAVRRRRRDAQGGARALPRAGRVLLQPLPARRRALREPRRLLERGDDPRARELAGAGRREQGHRRGRVRPAHRSRRSSTRATSSSAAPTRSPRSCARSRST